MTSEQFAYWLQGVFEAVPTPPSQAQWAMIKSHLETVFVKVTDQPLPYASNPDIYKTHTTPLPYNPNKLIC